MPSPLSVQPLPLLRLEVRLPPSLLAFHSLPSFSFAMRCGAAAHLLLAALAAATSLAAPIVIGFTCDAVAGPLQCAADLATCLSLPRPWLLNSQQRHYVCGTCWAEAYRCYKDCSNRFPPTFSSDCLNVCPKRQYDTCNPRRDWAYPGDLAPPTPTPT